MQREGKNNCALKHFLATQQVVACFFCFLIVYTKKNALQSIK